MRPVAKRIEKQNIQLAKLGHRLWRNLAEIGEIGGVSEAESVDFSFAMQELHRKKVRAKQGQLAVQRLELNLCQGRVVGIRLENVVERSGDLARGLRIGVKRNFLRPAKAQRTHILKTENVVGMRVRVKDRVDAVEFLADRLGAEVGRGVDQDHVSGIFHRDRGTGAAVVRI